MKYWLVPPQLLRRAYHSASFEVLSRSGNVCTRRSMLRTSARWRLSWTIQQLRRNSSVNLAPDSGPRSADQFDDKPKIDVKIKADEVMKGENEEGEVTEGKAVSSSPGSFGVFVELSYARRNMLSILRDIKRDYLNGNRVSEFVVAYNSSCFIMNLELVEEFETRFGATLVSTKKPVHMKMLQLLYQFAASHPAPSKIILVATNPIYDYFLSSFVDQFGQEVMYVTSGMQKSKAFVPAYGVQMLNIPLVRESSNEIASKKPTLEADSSNELLSRKPMYLAEIDHDTIPFTKEDCDNLIDSLVSTEKQITVREVNKEEEAEMRNVGSESNSNLKEAMEMHTICGSLPKEKEEDGSPVKTKSVEDLFENSSKVLGTKPNEIEPGRAIEEPAKMAEGNFVEPTSTSKDSFEETDLSLEEENLSRSTETETDSEVAFMNPSESLLDQNLQSLLSDADKMKEGTKVSQLASDSSMKASVLVTGFPDHISEMTIFKWLSRRLGAGVGSEIRSVDSETGSAVVQFKNKESALKVVSLLDGSLFDKNKLTASMSEYSSATSEDSSAMSEDSSATSKDSKATSKDSKATSEATSDGSEGSPLFTSIPDPRHPSPHLPPSKKPGPIAKSSFLLSTKPKWLLRKRIIDLLEKAPNKKKIVSSLCHDYSNRHGEFIPIRALYGRKPWAKFVEDNSDLKVEIIDRQMYICLVKSPKKETSKATISTLTKSSIADNQGRSAKSKKAGVTSKGEGMASKGEGMASKGEGVASKGKGVASKGEGVASKGEGVASKGEGGDDESLNANAKYDSGSDIETDKKPSYFSSLLQKIKERIY